MKEKVADSFEQVCFSGEGKGRINYKQNKFLFNYEALNEVGFDKRIWKLGVSIPAYGEETLFYNWFDSLRGKPIIKGTLIRKLLSQKKLSRSERKQAATQIEQFLVGLGAFFSKKVTERKLRLQDCVLASEDELDFKAPSGECGFENGQHTLTWKLTPNGKFHITKNIDEKTEFFLTGIDLGEKYFNRIDAGLRMTDKNKAPIFQFNLFVTDCTEKILEPNKDNEEDGLGFDQSF